MTFIDELYDSIVSPEKAKEVPIAQPQQKAEPTRVFTNFDTLSDIKVYHKLEVSNNPSYFLASYTFDISDEEFIREEDLVIKCPKSRYEYNLIGSKCTVVTLIAYDENNEQMRLALASVAPKVTTPPIIQPINVDINVEYIKFVLGLFLLYNIALLLVLLLYQSLRRTISF